MTTTRRLSLAAAGGLLIASTAAYVTYTPDGLGGGAAVLSSFGAEIRGDVSARLGGRAAFGPVPGVARHKVYSLTLGAWDSAGSIVFTRTDGRPFRPGSYLVSDRGEWDDVRALVVTGSPTRPTGVFRGWSGVLTIATASDSVLAGSFDLRAVGFLARDPENEQRRIGASGRFTAGRGEP